MKDSASVSRRRFMQSSGFLAGVTALRLSAPALAAITQAACTARDEGAVFRVLSAEEAADFTAMAARIIPTTDTPGATEAGVIYFWDNALGGYYEAVLAPIRELRNELNASLGKPFAKLDDAGQDDALRSIESDPRFGICCFLTQMGFFSMAKHGGNRDLLGWKLIGFDGHHGAWSHPFGYYDAKYLEERSDGE
jgi:gluconate 2-dehydrogenase gamma chain